MCTLSHASAKVLRQLELRRVMNEEREREQRRAPRTRTVTDPAQLPSPIPVEIGPTGESLSAVTSKRGVCPAGHTGQFQKIANSLRLSPCVLPFQDPFDLVFSPMDGCAALFQCPLEVLFRYVGAFRVGVELVSPAPGVP